MKSGFVLLTKGVNCSLPDSTCFLVSFSKMDVVLFDILWFCHLTIIPTVNSNT